ncbi:MAG: isoleucine--tRNA ligase [Anaerolineaceae bacterium]|nr:isoleucine--tRNA ligase [Anaerolineaceae bacterium]
MMADKKSYKKTLNLPKTGLAMKANLVQREPERQKLWKKHDIYRRIADQPAPRGRYFLHDGPPYANGDIHMGHLVNKVLKDIVVKYRSMAGYRSPYVPGWDCHGLPIEQTFLQSQGDDAADLTRQEIRRQCRKYARKWVKTQSAEFQRLGVFGDFDHPYLTMTHAYETGVIECFARFVERGLIYRQRKPIHWSYGCKTALAEAELEYKDIEGPSIYVNFPASGDLEPLVPGRKPGEPLHLMIWTTTPWTLPANLGLMVDPTFTYQAIRYEFGGESQVSLIAAELVKKVMALGGIDNWEVVAQIKGRDLVGKHYNHPFIDRRGLVVESEYVTLEDGTGLVHTAPGHGQEDYVVGLRNGLEPYSPVDEEARFDDTVPEWLRGLFVFDADPMICRRLGELGLMFHQGSQVHSYPHCWRSKTPVIFRATEQWFIAVDKPMDGTGPTLREAAIEEAKRVRWIPDWGRKRMLGMLESRPDWCISRQRSWGVPVPAFYCDDCGQNLVTARSVRKVRDHFAEHGADSWFRNSAADILGAEARCPKCGSANLKQEFDILDVWFESGSSWYAAAVDREGLEAPAELYLEGSDQHRGWFQASLLIGVAATGEAPFKTVLTHGFVVTAEGYKMSKSLGNAVNVQDEVAKLGADVLRLWVSSVDYQYDIRTSDTLISQLQDAYRKIRNTFRFLLGNLSDFDPPGHSVPLAEMEEIDRWILARCAQVVRDVTAAYEDFEFHRVYQLVHGFCNGDLSSIYLDIQKDRLYCELPDSRLRRSGQTAMYLVAHRLVRLLAPTLVHTADEIWSHIPGAVDEAAFVHLADWPEPETRWLDEKLLDRWQTLLAVRSAALNRLEALRTGGTIQSNMEAEVTLQPTGQELAALLAEVGPEQLARVMIVATVTVSPEIGGPGDQADQANGGLPLRIAVARSESPKCGRCWNLRESVGSVADYPDLCRRCAEVMAGK